MEHNNNATSCRRNSNETSERTVKNDNYRLPEAKRIVNARKRKNSLIGFLILAAIIVIAVWLLFDKLFVIRNFEIRGTRDYTAEEARLAAAEIGINEGDHIFGFNRKIAQENAKYRLSEFDKVEITFDMPDTVVMMVEETFPAMYTVFGGNGYVLSPALKVISSCSDISDCENMGIIRLEIDGIIKCVAGEYLITENNNDELLKRLYAVLSEEGVAADVTSIDVTDKYDISFEYKNRFKVLLGDEENITVKIRYMKAIIENLKPDDSGVIDVSDEEYRDATFKPYSKM